MTSPSNLKDNATTLEAVCTNLKVPALPQPESSDGIIKLDMSGGYAKVKLDDLGPLVVNQEGTLSRVNNWGQMNDVEKKNTLRILGKRNKLRLKKLENDIAEKAE